MKKLLINMEFPNNNYYYKSTSLINSSKHKVNKVRFSSPKYSNNYSISTFNISNNLIISNKSKNIRNSISTYNNSEVSKENKKIFAYTYYTNKNSNQSINKSLIFDSMIYLNKNKGQSHKQLNNYNKEINKKISLKINNNYSYQTSKNINTNAVKNNQINNTDNLENSKYKVLNKEKNKNNTGFSSNYFDKSSKHIKSSNFKRLKNIEETLIKTTKDNLKKIVSKKKTSDLFNTTNFDNKKNIFKNIIDNKTKILNDKPINYYKKASLNNFNTVLKNNKKFVNKSNTKSYFVKFNEDKLVSDNNEIIIKNLKSNHCNYKSNKNNFNNNLKELKIISTVKSNVKLKPNINNKSNNLYIDCKNNNNYIKSKNCNNVIDNNCSIFNNNLLLSNKHNTQNLFFCKKKSTKKYNSCLYDNKNNELIAKPIQKNNICNNVSIDYNYIKSSTKKDILGRSKLKIFHNVSKNSKYLNRSFTLHNNSFLDKFYNTSSNVKTTSNKIFNLNRLNICSFNFEIKNTIENKSLFKKSKNFELLCKKAKEIVSYNSNKHNFNTRYARNSCKHLTINNSITNVINELKSKDINNDNNSLSLIEKYHKFRKNKEVLIDNNKYYVNLNENKNLNTKSKLSLLNSSLFVKDIYSSYITNSKKKTINDLYKNTIVYKNENNDFTTTNVTSEINFEINFNNFKENTINNISNISSIKSKKLYNLELIQNMSLENLIYDINNYS